MTKLLKDLTHGELKKVYDNNSKIRQIAFESYSYYLDEWVAEYMGVFNGKQIDFYVDSYDCPTITVYNTHHFIDGLDNMQGMFCIFNDEDEKKIDEFKSLVDSLADYEMYGDEYTDCETKIEIAEKEIVLMLEHRIKTDLHDKYNDNYVWDYFSNEIDYMCFDELDDVYVDDDYIAYKTITKCYK